MSRLFYNKMIDSSIVTPDGLKDKLGDTVYQKQDVQKAPIIKDLLAPVDQTFAPLKGVDIDTVMKKLYDISFTKLGYPLKQTLRVDREITEQKYSLISFVPSPFAKPDKEGLYGILKIREGMHTEEQANKRGQYYVSYVSSYDTIDVGRGGSYIPLACDDRFCQEFKTIDIKKATQDKELEKKKQEDDQESERIKTVLQNLEAEEQEREELYCLNPEKEEFKKDVMTDYFNLRFKFSQAADYKNQSEHAYKKVFAKLIAFEKEYPNYPKQCISVYLDKMSQIGLTPIDVVHLPSMIEYNVTKELADNKEIDFEVVFEEKFEESDESKKKHLNELLNKKGEKRETKPEGVTVKLAIYPTLTQKDREKVNIKKDEELSKLTQVKLEDKYRDVDLSLVNKGIKENCKYNSYPFVRRVQDDGSFCNYPLYLTSFVQSQNATPDFNGCFGLFKYRGSYSTLEKCEQGAKQLFINCDSTEPIYVIYTGKEYPICTGDFYKKGEAFMKSHIDSVMRKYLLSKKDEENKNKEIAFNRQEKGELDEIKAAKDDPKSIHAYIVERVALCNAISYINESTKKIDEISQRLSLKEQKFPWLADEFSKKLQEIMKEKGITEDKRNEGLFKYLAGGLIMYKEQKEEAPKNTDVVIEFED